MRKVVALIVTMGFIIISCSGCGEATERQKEEIKIFNDNTSVTIDCYETNKKASESVNSDLIDYITKGVVSDDLYNKIDLNEDSNKYLEEQRKKGNKQDNEGFDPRLNECQIIFKQGYEDKLYQVYNKYLNGEFDYFNQNKSWYFDAYSVYADVLTTGIGASTATELIVINGMQDVSMKVKVYWYNGKIQSIDRTVNNMKGDSEDE